MAAAASHAASSGISHETSRSRSDHWSAQPVATDPKESMLRTAVIADNAEINSPRMRSRSVGCVSARTTPPSSGAKDSSGCRRPSALEIHDICVTCNNGPLSQLDDYPSKLNNEYFSKIIHSGDTVDFAYGFRPTPNSRQMKQVGH